MALLIVLQDRTLRSYLCMVFQYEEQRPELTCRLCSALMFALEQLYHRILFQPDVAGQHCHAASCDDGDRADFKRREGQSCSAFPCFMHYTATITSALCSACFPAFILWFCGLVQERSRCKNIITSAVNFGWHALLAGGMAAVVLLPAYVSTWRYGVCGEQFSKPDQAVCAIIYRS